MNFKRNCLSISLLIVSAFAVTSCGGDKGFIHCTYKDATPESEVDEVFDNGNYIKYANYSNYIAKDAKNEDVDLGKNGNVLRDHGNKKILDTTGEQKILVVPVEFTDYRCEDLGISKEKYIENVNKAFFGVSQNNNFVSVAQYFNISSYGKLKLDGTVVNNFYTFSMSANEIVSGKKSRSIILSEYQKIVDFCVSSGVNLNDYAIGGIEEGSEIKNVPIYLVYTVPKDYEKTLTDVFWAFTYNDPPISWSSYGFMYTEYGKPDAHTFIHETGHLLGLVDYYPTEDETDVYPTAKIDIMDSNIGDETAFSKMYLDWTRPYHAINSTTITLRPFEQTGDLILLNDYWNKTVFDEFYLIEFYTPTGLNNHDTKIGTSDAKLPPLPGIKIYHVDSRLAYFKEGRPSPVFVNYCDMSGTNPGTGNVNFAHDNNTYKSLRNESDSYLKNYIYELKLNGSKNLISGCASNENLFHTGDSFDKFETNTGVSINYKISVVSLSLKEAVIQIEKIA